MILPLSAMRASARGQNNAADESRKSCSRRAQQQAGHGSHDIGKQAGRTHIDLQASSLAMLDATPVLLGPRTVDILEKESLENVRTSRTLRLRTGALCIYSVELLRATLRH